MSWDDDELDADDEFDQDDDQTLPCPYCGEPVYDEAEQCPACGNYLSEEDAPRRPKPLWIVAGVAACIVIVICWVVLGL